MRRKLPYIFRNDVLQCPECKLEIAVALRDIAKGSNCIASDFKWPGRMPADAESMTCPECSTYYVRGGDYAVPYVKGVGWLE